MSERLRNVVAVSVCVVAIGVIIFGLSSDPVGGPTTEDRIATLSASIRCPFCNGESLADSQAEVAKDYRELIAERVEEGATDAEILEEFADNFGDSFILDTSTSIWSFLLWSLPVAVFIIGLFLLIYLRGRPVAERVATQGETSDSESGSQSGAQSGAHSDLQSGVAKGWSVLGGRVSGWTVIGVAVISITVALIGVFAVNSLMGPSTVGVEGVAEDVVTSDGGVDLSEITTKEMESVVADNPDVVGMRLALARRYFEEGDFTRALDHYMIVLESEQHPEALANVGWMTYISGMPEVALGYVEAALQRQPDSITATWFLGNIQFTLGNIEEARVALTVVVEAEGVPSDVMNAALSLLDLIGEG